MNSLATKNTAVNLPHIQDFPYPATCCPADTCTGTFQELALCFGGISDSRLPGCWGSFCESLMCSWTAAERQLQALRFRDRMHTLCGRITVSRRRLLSGGCMTRGSAHRCLSCLGWLRSSASPGQPELRSLCRYVSYIHLYWGCIGMCEVPPPPQQGHNLLHPIKLSHQGTESSRSPCKRVLVPYRAPAPGGGPPLGGQGWGESLPWVLRGWRAVPLTVAHLCPVTARCYRRGGRRPRSGCVASETSPSGLTRRQAAPHLPEGTAPRGSPQGPAGQQRVVSSAAEPGAGKARAAGERLSSAAGLFPQQRGGAEAHLALSGKPQVLSFRFPRWRYSRLLTPSAPSRRELPSGAGTPLEGGEGGRRGRAGTRGLSAISRASSGGKGAARAAWSASSQAEGGTGGVRLSVLPRGWRSAGDRERRPPQ